MDTILSINAVLAGLALVYGLYSRSLRTAIGTGFILALLHTLMVLLVVAQTGQSPTEAPCLGVLLDRFMQSGYAGFAHSRTVAYLCATAAILISVTLVAFIFSWIVGNILRLIVPRRASA
jgi:hypothetical protein